MKISRRKFQVSLMAIPVVFSGLAQFAFAQRKRGGGAAAPAAGGADVCSAALATATDNPGINFLADKSKVKDASLKKASGGVAWEKQNCGNCILVHDLKKCSDGERGLCPLLANKAVHANSWCASWAKKA